ncbi:MAG: hypothetical protein C4536_02440 [Actinobacteria bacterium]|jgi:hypothetical protein|nr:MAG: hypothetical protein C4536_02440 [Actinomycetota bacterium]
MTGWKEHLLVLCLFLVLVFLFTVPFALHAGDAVLSSHVDNLLNVWIISWDGHALVTSPTNLFQANMNYPSPDSLAFSEDLFSLALVAAPISWITGNAVFAYNFVSLIGFALCAYTMYLLVKYLTANRPAAFVAGVFFAFVPYHFSTIVHVHVSLYFLQPLILLFLFRYVDEGKPRFLVGLGIAFTAQALMSWYQLAFSSIPIGLFIIWRIVSPRRREYARYLLCIVGVLFLCMLVVIPFALPYFRLHRNIPEKESEPAINVISSAKSGDFFRVLPQNYFYDKLGFLKTGSPGGGDALFPGFLIFPLAVLALVYVFGRRKRGGADREDDAEPPPASGDEGEELHPQADTDPSPQEPQPPAPAAPPGPRRDYFAFFVVLGLVCFVLSLGPEPHGVSNIFYKALHKLPIYGFVRFPIRYHIMVLLSLAVVAGYGATWLYNWFARRKNRRWAAAAVSAVAALMLLEFLIVSLPYTGVAVGDAVPQVYRDLEGIEGAVVVEAPMPAVANSVVFEDPLTINYGTLDNTFLSALREQDATYFSIYHWKKLVNGMSGYYPLFYRRALVEMLAFPAPRALTFLRAAGVNRIVMHWDYYPAEQREEVREALAGAEGVTLVEDYPDGLSLYALDAVQTVSAMDLAINAHAPERTNPGDSFSASLGIFNGSGMPFINTDETLQHLEVAWKDSGGKVIKSEGTYFYAPFFIPDGEGAVAPFKVSAPPDSGGYTMTVTSTDGMLEGQAWETGIDVGEVAGVDSGRPVAGSLQWSPHISGPSPPAAEAPADAALQPYLGEVFSLDMDAYNDGSTFWERDRPSVEGAVVITAVWTREGDPGYEMVQQGMLPGDLSPGQVSSFPIALQAPTESGSYTLTLRLNSLGITYIGDPVIIPVTVSR